MVNSFFFLNGIRGKMYKAVKSMYEDVKARVRIGGDLTEAFMCSRGHKKGTAVAQFCSLFLLTNLPMKLFKKVNTVSHSHQISYKF